MVRRYSVFVLAAVCFAVFFSPTAPAQVTTIQIGTALTYAGPYTPFYGYYPDWKGQFIYLASEMNAAMSAAGLTPGPAFIKSMSFRPYTWYGTSDVNYENFSISASNTTQNLFVWKSGGQFTPLPDPVAIYGPQTKTFVKSTGVWQKFSFNQTFPWNGTDNIIFDLCYDRSGSYGAKAYAYWYYFSRPYLYPPYVPSQWALGNNASGPICNTATVQNGYTYPHPWVQFEVCTGPQTQLDYSAPAFVSLPGPIPVQYSIYHPSMGFTATLTFRFYTPTGTLVYTESTQVPVSANTLTTGTYNVNASSLTPGFYRMEVTSNVMSPCQELADFKWNAALMALNPGQVPCVVWPGDVNRDDIVNWGDRNALHKYVLDADLDPLWLTGPARYRVDAATNPLTFIAWEAQAAVPWYTSDGCHMDADGNGVVNSFDYLAQKINWMKTTDAYSFTKDRAAFSTVSFDMDQNYPNPFNPSTKIQYSVPEASQVTLTVTDMLGRTVATLVNGRVEAGVHSVTFDAAGMNSGNFIATVGMTGIESGMTFSKTIQMALTK